MPDSAPSAATSTLADLGVRTGERPVATVLHRGDAATVTLLSLPPGAEMPDHAAPRDAVVMGVEGSAVVTFEDETAALSVGVGVSLRAGRRHRVTPGAGGAVLLLIVSPHP